MITVQVVPTPGLDALRLLKERMRTARSFEWGNRKKNRLRHLAHKGGYIQVDGAGGVLVATVKATERDAWSLLEKFVGRLTDWLEEEIVSINIQLQTPPQKRRKA